MKQLAFLLLLSITFCALPSRATAQDEVVSDSISATGTDAEAIDMNELIAHHISNSHSWNIFGYKNDKGEIVNDNSVNDYFSNEYAKDKAQLYIPNLDDSTRSYVIMREYCDKHNIEIYNATRGGNLEVFKRVDLDEVFRSFKQEKDI